MNLKDKIKSCLIAILSFVMVFTAIPFISHADDIGAGDDVHGDVVFNVEWVFLKDNSGKPILRMHLHGGGLDYYGKDCRLANGNIRSRWASYPEGGLTPTGATLQAWLNELANSPQFSTDYINWLRNSALDFFPTTVTFNQEADCYAAWTGEIVNPPLGVTIEDAHTGQIAVEIDLESLQKPQGGYDVYCSRNDDAMEDNERVGEIRYKAGEWNGEDKRYVILPSPDPGYHWELVQMGHKDAGWIPYDGNTGHVWATPLIHFPIGVGDGINGGTGVSPTDEIRQSCGEQGRVYMLGFAMKPNPCLVRFSECY